MSSDRTGDEIPVDATGDRPEPEPSSSSSSRLSGGGGGGGSSSTSSSPPPQPLPNQQQRSRRNKNRRPGQQQQQQQQRGTNTRFITDDNNEDEESRLSSTPWGSDIAMGSHPHHPSPNELVPQQQPQPHSSRIITTTNSVKLSSASADRRKQFDATTPTLVDEDDDRAVDEEEDDSEMIQLQHTFDHPQQQHPQGSSNNNNNNNDNSTTIVTTLEEEDGEMIRRRTPGAASVYYKSGETTTTTPHRMMMVDDDDDPEKVATSRVVRPLSLLLGPPPGMGVDTSGVGTAPLGMGTIAETTTSSSSSTAVFEGTSTSLGASGGGGGNNNERLVQGVSEGLDFGLGLQHTSLDSSGDFSSSPGRGRTKQQSLTWGSFQPPVDSSQDEHTSNQQLTTDMSGSPSRRPESRSLYSFEGWATTKGPDPEAGRTNTGTFSPNILRLTEDLGNLLQDDEDDAYALEIPNAFRDINATPNVPGSSDYDWTGSYVFDAEYRRKPAVPTRSAVGAEKNTRRRVATGDIRDHSIQHSQQPDALAASMQNTFQPKPRRNEAFALGRQSAQTVPTDDRASPQLLIFGGAFAPPASSLHTGGFMRPVASLHGQEEATERHENHHPPLLDSITGYPAQHQFNSNFVTNAGYRVHSLSHESYQSMNHPSIQMSGSHQVQNAYPSLNPAYDALAPVPFTASQQSDMQANARVFIPNSTRSATPPFPIQIPRHPQWQYPPGVQPVAPPYQPTHEQFAWQADPTYYFGFEYGAPMQPPQSHGDYRVEMSPSPHPSFWQQQMPPQNIDHGPSNRNVTQPHVRSASVPTVSEMTSPSPHPSIAGSDYSAGITQRISGSRKETKRKQRSKKKPQKTEVSVAPSSGTKPAPTGKKKGDISRPASTTHSVDNEDTRVSPSEDPIDAKRLELVESPATRIAFKEFYRSFRGEERLSFQKAEEYALNALQDQSLPEAVHWRIYLELADLAKRSNRYVEARLLYQKVCEVQPYASQGWLEYSKLEEECGRMNRVLYILLQGLQHCELSENLLTRAVKHYEKMGNLDGARGLLAKLKHVGIEKVWRTVLEGALLEARAGNIPTARRVLKYLMHHVPWYGPLYLEAYRLEKDQGNTAEALTIVERGLQAIPRYGPLWFGAFRLCEEIDVLQNRFDLPSTMSMIERAAKHISKELVWKVHLDAAQMLERSALERASVNDPSFNTLLERAQHRLALTILTSPINLRWKVWLAAGRIELELGNTQRARALFIRAHEVVSEKGRSSTLLECARLEDFVGDTSFARAILCKGRFLYGNDWKVWLEGILLEIRAGNIGRAVELCENALEIHRGTGRLWATLVQLRQFFGRDAAQQIALRRALNAVPKSGEVWCEGGRMHLNPFSDTFDLDRARRHFHFATRFTPQYGDGFVETIRLELIRQWIAPIAQYVWDKTKHGFKAGLGGAFEDGLTKYVTDVSLAISIATIPQKRDTSTQPQKILYSEIVTTVRDRLDLASLESKIDLNDVTLACVNADPNYGLLWFHCRKKSTDTPRRIIEDATAIITAELRSYAHLYMAAIVRREAVLSTVEVEKPSIVSNDTIEVNDPLAVKWEDYSDTKLRAAPSLETIFNPTDPTTGLELLESTARGPLFATGLAKLNKRQSLENMTLSDRRKALFGIDALFP